MEIRIGNFNDRFYSGQLRESPLRRAHDIPCRISHTNIAWLPLPRKEHRRFEGEPGSLRDDFFPPTAEPLMYIPRMLRIVIFPPNIYGVLRGPACSPHSAVALRQGGLHRQGSDRRCPVWAKNISFVSICASVAMFRIDCDFFF
jgi:hypothetical protein